ncbi:MAG: GNAT family N-acetyltransferase [Anaerolineae bacterium]|nr:GNAT family N-acetyltransferase [Anaerolineae bacterium]MCO5192445.1 GNAT family N-acetyltransferase [Anaerolineae bacterium]MCO5203433.1 GNAT family N-acetyltransferase [Anaerolineae bacterium]
MTTTTLRQELAVKIEPFDYTDETYEQAVAIYNTCWPNYPNVPADWKRSDKNRNPEYFFERYVVRRASDGKMIAVGVTMHRSWAHEPRRFYIDGWLHPDYRGLGVGKAMYAHSMQRLAPFRPISFDTETSSDKERALRFLTERGFEVKTREHESGLDLAQFEPEQWAGTVNHVADSGIAIKNLVELRRADPDYLRKIYDLICETERDIPYHATFTPDPFELWRKRFEKHPTRIEEAYLLALDGDDYVGITMLYFSRASDKYLYTGFTAVKRTHRRRGIATALKVRSLGYAKANFSTVEGQAPTVLTGNEVNNPMYQINVKLGFTRRPDWLMLVKTVDNTN